MELVTDSDGQPAPRLGEIDLSPEKAREYHEFLIRQIVRMLDIGLIHGDLSEFNVLVDSDGPVIIDLPQVVNAAGNNGALAMLERDVNNIRGTLARFAPELLATEFAREMWDVYERGESPDYSHAMRRWQIPTVCCWWSMTRAKKRFSARWHGKARYTRRRPLRPAMQLLNGIKTPRHSRVPDLK
jgi:hypothetical protein